MSTAIRPGTSPRAIRSRGRYAANLALILENTTGGAAYVDEVDLYEVLPDGELGPQLLRDARFNSHLSFDLRRGAAVDTILEQANARDLAFKLVISEKNEYLLSHLGQDGLPDPIGGDFNRGDGSPTHRLHKYYWRHLFARFGAFRSALLGSWSTVSAGPGEHFQLAAALAMQAAADGNPHLASTSTWATLAEEAWNDPGSAPIGFAVFTPMCAAPAGSRRRKSWLATRRASSAEYDRAAQAAGFGKPVVWGEIGIDGTGAQTSKIR